MSFSKWETNGAINYIDIEILAALEIICDQKENYNLREILYHSDVARELKDIWLMVGVQN